MRGSSPALAPLFLMLTLIMQQLCRLCCAAKPTRRSRSRARRKCGKTPGLCHGTGTMPFSVPSLRGPKQDLPLPVRAPGPMAWPAPGYVAKDSPGQQPARRGAAAQACCSIASILSRTAGERLDV